MTRYFFVVEAPLPVSDRVGMNLQNLSQVKHEALRRAAEFASDTGKLEEPGAIVVTARDSEGEAIMTVSLVCSIAVHRQTLGALAPLGLVVPGEFAT